LAGWISDPFERTTRRQANEGRGESRAPRPLLGEECKSFAGSEFFSVLTQSSLVTAQINRFRDAIVPFEHGLTLNP
jgi:hypothetical protein